MRSRSGTRAWALAVLALVGPALVVGTLFLLPYLRGDSMTPFGFDTPHYIWRANLVIAEGLDALAAMGTELNPNAERPAFAVLAAIVDSVGGPDPALLVFVVPAVFALAVGLAAGAFSREVFHEPTWAFPLYAIVVGGSLGVVRTAVGSTDALIAEALLLGAATSTLVGAMNRRGLAAGVLLFTAAALTHWILALLMLALFVGVALALGPDSLRQMRAGSPLLATPSGSIGAVVASSLAAGFAALFTLTPFPPELPTIPPAKLSQKVSERLPALRLQFGGPAALLGGWALWSPSTPPRRWGLILMAWWAGTLVLVILAYEVFGVEGLPVYRVAEFALVVPILGAAAIVGLARWSSRWGTWAVALAAIAIALLVAYSLRVSEESWASSESLLKPEVAREVLAASEYVRSVDTGQPVVFVVSVPTLTGADRAIRASLPGDLIASTYTFVGRGDDLLAGRTSDVIPPRVNERTERAMGHLFHQDFVAIWIDSLNPLLPPDDVQPIAPGVGLDPGPRPSSFRQSPGSVRAHDR